MRTLGFILFIAHAIACHGAATTLTAGRVTELGKGITNSVITNGLRGWWSMDGPSTYWTSATAGTNTDLTGNGNLGTFQGMARATNPAAGVLGQAMSFPSANDYITCGSGATLDDLELQGGGGMSVALWYRGAIHTGTPILIAKGASAGWRFQLTTGGTPYNVQFAKDGATDLIVTWNAKAGTNGWQHLVLTWDGGSATNTAILYIDGWPQQRSSGTVGVTPGSDAAQSLTIGGLSGGATFAGALDDVRVYNRVLSQSDVEAIYTATFTGIGDFPTTATGYTADAIIDFETSTDGTVITGVILTNSTHGSFNGLWVVPASSNSFWISSAAQVDTLSTYTVSGTPYQAGTRGLANYLGNADSEFLPLTLPAQEASIAGSVFIKCNVPASSSGLHDLFVVDNLDTSNSGVIQWNASGARSHTTASGIGTFYGNPIRLNPGQTYDYAWRWTASAFEFRVYSTTNWPRPLTRWKNIGYSTAPLGSNAWAAKIKIGHNSHSELNDVTNYYDAVVIDYTSDQFPIAP